MFYSLRSRLILTFSVLLVVPFGFLAWIVTEVSTETIENLIQVSTSQTMKQYATYADSLFDQTEELSQQILASEMTQEWLSFQENTPPGRKAEFTNSEAMRSYLTSITSSNSELASVGLFLEDRFGIWSYDKDFMAADWYARYYKNGIRWLPAHYDDDQPSRTVRRTQINSYIYPLTNLQELVPMGVIKINMPTTLFREPLANIKLGKTGAVYLLDGAGRPVLDQDLSLHGRILQEGAKDVRKLIAAQPEGHFWIDEPSSSFLVFYQHLSAEDWMLVGVVSKEELFSKIAWIKRQILWVGALLICATIGLAYWLAYGITNPLSKLARTMKEVERGDFSKTNALLPAAKSNSYEISYVVHVFHRMTRTLRDYIQIEVDLNLRRKDAEYKALLLQINPHFLYNTLEVIGSLSVQGRNRDVLKATESLGRMLRYSLKLDSDEVRLKEELDYARFFASILKLTYGERIEINVTDNTGDDGLAILKFILQPLVENAVKFSIDHAEKVQVDIAATKADGRLCLSVKDNGIGMGEALRRDLTEQLDRLQGRELLRSEGKQIGLRNVLARCRLHYEEQFAVRIDSEEGKGTEIRLIMPIKESGHHV
ncbi:cache domain-containing sensor histidine kinase [Paenibacillus arenilitoris]|uniref:histidine kinase n=1 Tax=Paenibacillus arenilitoris TaxID=2772299 RepID=A0A927CPA5_9BACL|nr:sensor histidine kinase [Paenibacillus arenilitoris]MBD2870577.1 sensor histidine kinase [Paenibacillus arenilitoris]